MKIIAESASNHSGQVEYLMKLADAARQSGADYFTVQILNPESFCAEDYERFDVVAEIAFSFEQWATIFDYCNEIGIEVIPCPLDMDSLKFCLIRDPGLIKIHATDIVNVPFLEEVKKSGVPVILETQCATHQDIKLALSIIGSQIDAIIHGYSNYPTPIANQRLNSLDYLKEEFGYEVGFADHTLDILEIPLMTLAKGAKYLEKHITLNRDDRHYDWQVSLQPDEFKKMVAKIRTYEEAMGFKIKHPDSNEAGFRGVLYKKVLGGDLNAELRRADHGNDYLTELFYSFPKKTIGVGIIARLKSKRLKNKVLKPFLNGTLIEDLYARISTATALSKVSVITSYLPEDNQLAEHCRDRGMGVFLGHPESVIDRMLSFAFENKLGIISRVTGDNPFSDPLILGAMIELMMEEDLDFVKCNNAPMGVGVELYSTAYLWRLYLEMENPHTSEYLSWIALNDKNSKKGSIELEFEDKNLSFYNLSVDYEEDYLRCQHLLKKIAKNDFKAVVLRDVLRNLKHIEPSDKEMIIKLPGGKETTLEGFDTLIKNARYAKRRILKV